MKYRQSGLSVEAIQWDGNADKANEFIGEAYWWQNENGSNDGWQTWDGENHKRTVYITQPTHWMPLPQAPGA